MSRSASNFLQALLAVLVGNAVYFLLKKHLPAAAQHIRYKTDLGTLVDFWFCLAVFGVIKTVVGWRERSKLPRN
jgi:hypothetical protein